MQAPAHRQSLIGVFWLLATALVVGVAAAGAVVYGAEHSAVGRVAAPSLIGAVVGLGASWASYRALWVRVTAPRL